MCIGGGDTLISINVDSLSSSLKQRRLWRICGVICALQLHLNVYIFDAEDISGIICCLVTLDDIKQQTAPSG